MPSKHEYSEDLFADTRMTFGEHIEELRGHLVRAIKGLLFCMVIGFVLDAVGAMIGSEWLGVGRPMFEVITRPVRKQLIAFYDRRMETLERKSKDGRPDAIEATEPKPFKMAFTPEAIAVLQGKPPPPPGGEPVWVDVSMQPIELYKAMRPLNNYIRPPELTALSVTESMVVYFKVSLLCGLIIASPYVFWQGWSFIAAGLYPHEKRLVHYYLPISLGLFLIGVIMCQFAVIPRSIEALLWFNEWLGVAPDLRLNEWLSFAILLPLVFGVSFQTPLVMMFMARIGVMDAERFAKQWRLAAFVLAVFAAIITPTPDAITWFAMWAPMIGLYALGIYLCKWTAQPADPEFDVPEADELIEV